MNKTGVLLDALKKIRQIIRESKQEPNVIATIDFVAMQAIHYFFKVEYPIQGAKDNSVVDAPLKHRCSICGSDKPHWVCD